MIAAALLQLLSQFNAPSARGGETPSVLVMIADDLGQEPVGAAWSVTHPSMPNLASLASAGFSFSRAYSWPTCAPSRVALFTGLFPRRGLAIRDWGLVTERLVGVGDIALNALEPTHDRIALDNVFLPEALVPGHRTFFTGKWHLGRAPLGAPMDRTGNAPNAQGFERVRAYNATAKSTGGGVGHFNWERIDDGFESIETTYATDAQKDELLAWWAATSGPKFAVLSTSLAHAPFNTPPGMSGGGTTRDKYIRGVEYLDGVLGEVVSAVDDGNTYIVFVGDNGCPNDARPTGTLSGYWKGGTYEGGVRVPLVIVGPGISEGFVTDRLVSIVDIPATLMELVGAPPSRGFTDSITFADELGFWAGAPAREFVLTERWDVTSIAEGFPVGYDDLAIIRSTWKLRRADADGNGPGGFTDLLYNLSTDPFEQFPKTPAQAVSPYATLSADLATLPARAQ